LVFLGPNNSRIKWFLRIPTGREYQVAGADVHFFLDFQSKEPYI
jgi:hypothetical protein